VTACLPLLFPPLFSLVVLRFVLSPAILNWEQSSRLTYKLAPFDAPLKNRDPFFPLPTLGPLVRASPSECTLFHPRTIRPRPQWTASILTSPPPPACRGVNLSGRGNSTSVTNFCHRHFRRPICERPSAGISLLIYSMTFFPFLLFLAFLIPLVLCLLPASVCGGTFNLGPMDRFASFFLRRSPVSFSK